MMEEEIKKIADNLKKEADNWVKYVDVQSDKVVDYVRANTKDITDAVKKERKKMELRSEIGEHSRTLTRAYTRLGEAYYDATSQHKTMEDVKDLMDLIASNKKLIELLQIQLNDLDRK